MNPISAFDECALNAALCFLRERPPSNLAEAATQIRQVRNGALADAEVVEGTIGRFFSCPCYIVKTERFQAALPHRTADAIQQPYRAGRQQSRTFWAAIKWFHPAYLTNGDIGTLYKQIKAGVNQEQALEEFLIQHYDQPETLAATVSQKYANIPVICDRVAEIWETFRAFYAGYTGVAVTALIPLVEACFCNWGGIRPKIDKADQALQEAIRRTLSYYSSRLVYQGNWVPEEYLKHSFLADVDEVAHCLITFQQYFTESLFVHTDRFKESNGLNRNGILHGMFTGHHNRANFFKLISVLDMAAFAHTLGNSGLRVGLQRAQASPHDRYRGEDLGA